MKVYNFALAVCAITFATPAKAEDVPVGVPIGGDADLVWTAPEAGYLIAPLITVHSSAPVFTINYRLLPGDGAGLAVPGTGRRWGAGFHISGGLRFHRNRAWALGAPMARATYSIDGRLYPAALVGTQRAGMGSQSAAPLVTIGYGGALSRRLAFGIEAGALFHGAAKANAMTAAGTCSGGAPAAYCGGIGADLDAERLGVHRGLGEYRVYPLVQVRMGYRF